MKRLISAILLAAILVSCNAAPPAETATDTETPSITTEEPATEAVPPKEIIPTPPAKTNTITYQIKEYFDSDEKIESDIELAADVPEYMGRRSFADTCGQFYSKQNADEACSHGIEIYDTYKVESDFVMDKTVTEKYPSPIVIDSTFKVSNGITPADRPYILYETDNGNCFLAVLYFRFHENYFLTLTYEDKLENHGHMLDFLDSFEIIYNEALPFQGSSDEVIEFLENCDFPHEYTEDSIPFEREPLFHAAFKSEDEFNKLLDFSGTEIQNNVDGKKYYLGMHPMNDTLTCIFYLIENRTPDACGEMLEASYTIQLPGDDSTTERNIKLTYLYPDHWDGSERYVQDFCLYVPALKWGLSIPISDESTIEEALYLESTKFQGEQMQWFYAHLFDGHTKKNGKTVDGHDYLLYTNSDNTETNIYAYVRITDDYIISIDLREQNPEAHCLEEFVKSIRVEVVE